MHIETHIVNNFKIAEVISDATILQTASDSLDLMGNLYYQGFEKIILHEHNLAPAFFELKNGMAGEILQKFSNYRMQLAIVGSFEKYASKALHDFIYESNQGKLINFVNSVSAALT